MLLTSPEHPIFHFFEDHQIFEDYQHFGRSSEIMENRACPNLEAMGVREALVQRLSRSSRRGGARCRSSTSVAQMLAAASVKFMDALFGLAARNDAEWSR